jgi:hypothetical protein
VSEAIISSIFKVEELAKQVDIRVEASLLLAWLLIESEDGGNKLLRNSAELHDVT